MITYTLYLILKRFYSLNPDSCIGCNKNSPFETEDLFDGLVTLQ